MPLSFVEPYYRKNNYALSNSVNSLMNDGYFECKCVYNEMLNPSSYNCKSYLKGLRLFLFQRSNEISIVLCLLIAPMMFPIDGFSIAYCIELSL
ncbi:hypothetical protein HOLleu_36752 [Holothuria leucospilota]|uniref:Uncharacterized protein n=1 Tax=Holothuria leucospilota TaxID=206669 RepID=A0A9Q0YPP5_HOLLE|nr:hypothetical protein HOLleu_36752 [Holothuria leucospilota]